MVINKEKLRRAVLWEADENKKVRCNLCNHRCVIAEGKVGRCFVRKNIDGELYSLNYNHLCAANSDPIEKKPLFHFQPGTRSFSIACVGCNFRCDFCQNWQISQARIEELESAERETNAEEIVDAAFQGGCKSIAYTYTEPTIFMELCSDCGRLAKEKGLANVFVSNGYMTHEAIDFAKEWLDGINIDLKAFTEEYYQNFCKASVGPVLETIKHIAKKTSIWLELTTLVVPGHNDSEEELRKIADFVVSEAGPTVPWHISRFYPQYKYTDSYPTPVETLERALEIGKNAGLYYVYVGNMPGADAESTYCNNCGKMLIKRVGYRIMDNRVQNGKCPDCGAAVKGYELG